MHVLALELGSRVCAEGDQIFQLGNLSLDLNTGDTVRLSVSAGVAVEDLLEILSLRNFGWSGRLVFMGYPVHGTSDGFPELRDRHVARFPTALPDGVCGEVLAEKASTAGLTRTRTREEIEQIAEDYRLEQVLDTEVSSLPPAQRQLLGAAILEWSAPRLIVIDGARPLYPGSRIVVEGVMLRLAPRSAVVIVEREKNFDWDFLTTTVRPVSCVDLSAGPVDGSPGRSSAVEPSGAGSVGVGMFSGPRSISIF